MNVSVNPAIVAIGATVANELKSFRSSAVTSENRATPLARSVLAALVAGTATPAFVVTSTLHAFGNPKSPKGKALDKLSSSGDYLPGWGATRKTVTDILDIYENIEADAPRNVEDTEGNVTIVGDGAIRDTIIGFILNNDGAPKSLRALKEAIKAHLAAFVAATAPDNSEAANDSDEALATETGQAVAPVAMTLRERVDALIVAYNAASADEKADAQDGLTALFLAVDADITVAAQPEVEALAA